MKWKTNARKRHASRVPSEAQLAALRQSTTVRKQVTVERLRMAIEALKAKKREISVQTIYEECGLRYAAIHRNPEALALFRASSTSLVAKKKRTRRKSNRSDEDMLPPRDPLLNYKKPQLVERLRTAQQQLLEVQQQFTVQAEAGVRREARIAELEARLVELEPYRTFVEHIRQRIRHEEHGRDIFEG